MTDAEKVEIHRLASEGLSARAIARVVGSTHPTVTKVLASPPPLELPAPELPEHMRPLESPAASGDAPADDAPAIEQARYLMREARAALRTAQACGDGQLAQRQTRNAAFLMNVLARLEAAEVERGDGFHITEAEIAKSQAELNTRIAGLAVRGAPRCAKCSRQLSISWALGISEDEAEALDLDAADGAYGSP